MRLIVNVCAQVQPFLQQNVQAQQQLREQVTQSLDALRAEVRALKNSANRIALARQLHSVCSFAIAFARAGQAARKPVRRGDVQNVLLEHRAVHVHPVFQPVQLGKVRR